MYYLVLDSPDFPGARGGGVPFTNLRNGWVSHEVHIYGSGIVCMETRRLLLLKRVVTRAVSTEARFAGSSTSSVPPGDFCRKSKVSSTDSSCSGFASHWVRVARFVAILITWVYLFPLPACMTSSCRRLALSIL